MPDLTINVDSVEGFLGYPLALAIDEPREKGLLYQGAIRVGQTLTIPLDTDALVRVRLLVPQPKSGWKTLTMASAPDEKVTFRVAAELLATRQSVGAERAPQILLPVANAEFLAGGVPSEFVPISADPFVLGPLRLDANFMLGPTAGAQRKDMPLLNTLRVPLAPKANAVTCPPIRFVVRPFVRLWCLRAGETSWRVDPESSIRLKDTDDGLRSVKLPAGTRYRLEIGTPSGPNQFVYAPPGPLVVELRALDVPTAGAGGIEMAVKAEPVVNLLLTLTRVGSGGEGRGLATLPQAAADTPVSSNVALVLAYFCLRHLELDRAFHWLQVLAKENLNWPDSFVIQGWRALREESPEPEAAQAAFIVAATDAGPPAYTEGLRLLMDGIELFHYAADVSKLPNFEPALQCVQHWCSVADWEKTLTTLRDDRPASQTPGARVPFPLREVFPLF